MSSITRSPAAILAAGPVAVLVSLALAACGGKQVAVCEGRPATLQEVAMTSTSDIETAKALAGPISDQLIAEAVRTCGTLQVGIADAHPETLVLHSVKLVPAQLEAYNPKVLRDDMTAEAKKFVRQHLLDPLARIKKGTPTSPFLGVSAKVAQESKVRGITGSKLIIVGDTVAVENTPSGRRIDMRGASVSAAALREFVPLLKGGPSCVMIIGEAIGSKLPAERIRAAGAMLKRTYNQAGVQFAASSSPDLPASCPKAGSS